MNLLAVAEDDSVVVRRTPPPSPNPGSTHHFHASPTVREARRPFSSSHDAPTTLVEEDSASSTTQPHLQLQQQQQQTVLMAPSPEGPSDSSPLFLSLSPSLFVFPPPLTFVEVSRQMAKQFFNGALNQTMLFIGGTMCAMTVGQFGTETELASVSAGLSTMGVLAFSVSIGLAAALDGLVSQCYGRKDYAQLVRWTQVGIVVCVSVSLCMMTVLHLYGQAIIRVAFGPEYVEHGYSFLQGAMGFLLVIGPVSCLGKSLQATQKADLATRASFASAIVTVVSARLIIPHYLVFGAGLCWSLSGLANLLSLIAVIVFDDGNPLKHVDVSWHPRQFVISCSVEHVTEYMKVGVATWLAVSAEWVAFELLVVIAASLHDVAVVAALNVYFQMISVAFALPNGLGVSASSHIGRLLGANRPEEALVFARATLVWCLLLPFLTGSLIVFFHESIFGLYVNDADRAAVLGQLKPILWVLFFTTILDSAQFSLQAIYRGVGKAEMAPGVVLASLWLVGLPTAYVLSRHFDLRGLATGFALGMLVEGPMLLRKITTAFDFRELAREAAQHRAEHDDGGPSSLVDESHQPGAVEMESVVQAKQSDKCAANATATDSES